MLVENKEQAQDTARFSGLPKLGLKLGQRVEVRGVGSSTEGFWSQRLSSSSCNKVRSNSSLWAAQTVFLPYTNATRSAVQ